MEFIMNLRVIQTPSFSVVRELGATGSFAVPGMRQIGIDFRSGLTVRREYDIWVVTETSWYEGKEPTDFGEYCFGRINQGCTTEELLCMIPDIEKIEFLQRITYFDGITISDFMESITNQDIKDFIIFNLDLITGGSIV
jgi:hypothetical protein